MNRRLEEIQKEKELFKTSLKNAETISESLAFQGKIDLLENEEKRILEKNEVTQ